MNYRYFLLIIMGIGWISFCQYQSHDVPAQTAADTISRNEAGLSPGWAQPSGAGNGELKFIAQGVGHVSERPFAKAKSQIAIETNPEEKTIQDLVNATIDTWAYVPEIANGSVSSTGYRFLPVKNDILKSKSTHPHLMSYMILIACLAGVFFYGSYLLHQDKAAIYNPANPLSLILFMTTLLLTAVLLIVDWSTIRYRMFSTLLKSRFSTMLGRFSHSGTGKMQERKLVEIPRTS